MKISLKTLHVENFKGIKQIDVSFENKTKIKGQNASGKTSLFDAFTFLLFNKNSAGEEKFQIRPLDQFGNRIDNVEIKVVASMDVDGKEVQLSKTQKQKWVKKRGSETAELQGNENVFEIDGYPKSEADYKAFINDLVNEDLFKMITNPQYFSNMKWKDQREILMKFVSDLSDAELARQMGADEFAVLIPELEKASSTDDIQKKYSKALSEWKKKQAEIPVRIDELSKSLVDIDVAELELAERDLRKKIMDYDVKIASYGDELAKLMDEDMNLQFEISAIKTSMERTNANKRIQIETALYENDSQIKYCRSGIEKNGKNISDNNEMIEQAEKRRNELGTAYKEELAKVFDSQPYLFREEDWQFDEKETVCKLCGQTLPDDKIEQIKAEFETRKKKAKEDTANALLANRTRFEKQRNDNLERIKTDGFAQKNIIEELLSKNTTIQKNIEAMKQALEDALRKQAELNKQLECIPTEVDYTQNEEYMKLNKQRNDIDARILEIKNGPDLTTRIREEQRVLSNELDAVRAKIERAAINTETEERISQLEEEQHEVGQKVADQEQMLYLLETFIRAKMERISSSINKHFKTVNFKLFETQINGGLKECCECTVNGVPYSTLNSGHRIVAGLDIIRSLSDLYGATAPIFVDNAESLNEYNVPDMETQMILLAVSDDKELIVEGA